MLSEFIIITYLLYKTNTYVYMYFAIVNVIMLLLKTMSLSNIFLDIKFV